jgi:methionine synthase II (cobalamin-independent)
MLTSKTPIPIYQEESSSTLDLHWDVGVHLTVAIQPTFRFNRFFECGLELITSIRKNMVNSLMKLDDKRLLRKPFIIETIKRPSTTNSRISRRLSTPVTAVLATLLLSYLLVSLPTPISRKSLLSNGMMLLVCCLFWDRKTPNSGQV